MLTRVFTAAALAAVLSSLPVHAQSVRASSYGGSSVFNTALDPSLSIRLRGDDNSSIQLAGGFFGEVAVLAISAAPASIPLGCCAQIWIAPPMVTIAGQFGVGGSYSVPLNVSAPALQGVTLYMQGVDVLAGGGLSLSGGLRVAISQDT